MARRVIGAFSKHTVPIKKKLRGYNRMTERRTEPTELTEFFSKACIENN
jgi:hypothetical protein